MALATFQISDDLNIDGAIVNLAGATSGQTLVYSASGTVFNPTTITPVGTVIMYVGSTAPSGWLVCDGTVHNTSSYPTLGALLVSKYGGNGTTTFGVPNFNGRVPVAMNAATTTPPTTLASATNTYNHSHTAVYGTDGTAVSLDHTHNTAQGASHYHDTTADKGNHTHGPTSYGGSTHTHSLAYKTGNVSQATGYGDDGHQHQYANSFSNHAHNSANQSANHTHGGTYDTSMSHVHQHNSVTLNTNAQSTSISSHGHGTLPAMRFLFVIKT